MFTCFSEFPRLYKSSAGCPNRAFAEIGPAGSPAPYSLLLRDFLPRIAPKAIGDSVAMHTSQSPRLYRQILYPSQRCFCSRAPWTIQQPTGADHPLSVSEHHPSQITSGRPSSIRPPTLGGFETLLRRFEDRLDAAVAQSRAACTHWAQSRSLGRACCP